MNPISIAKWQSLPVVTAVLAERRPSPSQMGASVIVAERRKIESFEALELIHAAGRKAEFVKTDVSDESQVEAMISQAMKVFGRIDFAFNNTAIHGEVTPLDAYP